MVYDWYVVGMCCGRMVWHIWLGVAAWGVFVSLTSLISLLQVRRASGICVNNYDSVIWYDLVGELHVVNVYQTFLLRIHAIWCLCWVSLKSC